MTEHVSTWMKRNTGNMLRMSFLHVKAKFGKATNARRAKGRRLYRAREVEVKAV